MNYNEGGLNGFENAQNRFYEEYKKQMEQMGKLNTIVAGKTGVGKSFLINGVFGQKLAEVRGGGLPVTKYCEKYTLTDSNLSIYDTKGFETGENDHEKLIFEKLNEINSAARNPDDCIHFCWYCIADMGDRIESNEIKFINDVNQRMKVPVIIVITKSLGRNNPKTKEFIEAIEKELSGVRINIIPVMAEAMIQKTEYGTITIEQHGLKELVDTTSKLLPDAKKDLLIAIQKVDIKRKIEKARTIALVYAGAVAASSFNPIPMSDAPIMMGIQAAMLAHITVVFGIPLSKLNFIQIITGVGLPLAAAMAGRTLVSLLKFVVGPGTVISGGINASTGATITFAIGNIYIKVLESALKSGDINEEILKDGLKEGMEDFNMDTYKKQWEENKNNYDKSEAERILNEEKNKGV